MPHIPWTEKEKDALRQLAKAGKTIEDAQKVFPYRSRASINNKANEEGLRLSGPTHEINVAEFNRIMKGK